MINNKETLLLRIFTEDEEKRFREFVKEITGKPLCIDYCRCSSVKDCSNCYLEITWDLLEAKIIYLQGYISNSFYPSYRRFKDENIDVFMSWYKEEYLVTKNLSIIKWIPHASVELPNRLKFHEPFTYFIGLDIKYAYKMADLGVDDLFKGIKGIEIKAPYTRLFCDVERYKDNAKEPMAKFGQGYIYKKTYDGKEIHKFGTINGVDYHEFIDEYYDSMHELLNKTVKEELDKGKDVLILDLHSYSDELADSIGKSGPYPDICIGLNKDFNNEPLLNLIIKKIKEKGYNYQINFPYEGSIVPNDVANGKINGKVDSVMIGVNKRLYL